MLIYKITNRINGKVYIGQTTRPLTVRWKQHCNPANTNCIALHRAIQKYGKENFTVEQIDVACDIDELNEKEIYWIKFYDSVNSEKGYNLKVGGEHTTMSDETRHRLGNGNRGKTFSEGQKRKMSESHKGSKMSKEAIAKSVATKRATGVYEKIADIARINGKKCGKKVRCIETGKVYASITEAACENGVFRANISACLNGVTKTAGKLHWEYL